MGGERRVKQRESIYLYPAHLRVNIGRPNGLTKASTEQRLTDNRGDRTKIWIQF